MRIEPTNNISFGILKGYKNTSFENYMWGIYKGNKITVFNSKKYNQRLIYVSNNKMINWFKSKLFYVQDGAKKIIRSERSAKND